MTIYLDVVFIQNILMDSLILLAVSCIIKIKCNIFKLLISSTLGAFYVIGMYMTNSDAYSSLLVKFMLSLAMVYIAFTPNSIQQIIKYLIIFYLTSFVFGGCTYALYQNGFFSDTYTFKIALLGAFIGIIFLIFAFKLIKSKFSKSDMFCSIDIIYNQKTAHIKAMIDSGNMLKDPLTGLPVVIVEQDKLSNIIDMDILHNIQNMLSGEGNVLAEDYSSKFRLIPFSSLGKQNGMLLGFKPDYITISSNDMTIQIDKVIIRNL